MYLLEYLEQRLKGEAWTLGRQLMYMPWHCDPGLLKPHVPRDVFARFAKVQRYCRSRMQPGAKAPLLERRFHYVALNAFVVTSPDQVVHAQSRLLEMHDSFVGQAVEDLVKEGLSFRSFSPQDQAPFISLYALSYFVYGRSPASSFPAKASFLTSLPATNASWRPSVCIGSDIIGAFTAILPTSCSGRRRTRPCAAMAPR